MPIDEQDWSRRLAELIVKHDVPAASMAVLSGGAVQTFAAGVLNRVTGVEATTDSVFQIGSVTKAYTATVALSLVDAGRLDLDRPIAVDVPELRLADLDAHRLVTLRHLLAHTSGIDGDHFVDLGRGEDVLERYAGTCADLAQVMPPGAAWAYCNSGYSIVGRAVERATGLVFDQAVQKRLLKPLGLSHSCLLPEDCLRHRVAYGHVPGAVGLTLAPVAVTPRTMAPAGGVMATARDVLDFVRLYLDGGVTRTGERLLSQEAIRAAWTPQVEVPDPSMGRHWGLGWMLTEWGGKRIVGHDGGTVGQGASVRVLPEDGVAVVLLGNGPGIGELMADAVGGVVEELCGVRPPAAYEPHGGPGEQDDWFGVYERMNMRISVLPGSDGPAVEVAIGGFAADSLGASRFTGQLRRAADGTYLTDAVGGWMPLVPFALPDGSACLHFGGRAQLRRTLGAAHD